MGCSARVVASALALLLLSGPAVAAEVRARLGASTVSIDETVLMTVEAFDVDGELDVGELERDFEVTVRSRASRLEIVDGERSAVGTVVLELVPRAVGLFTVPPVGVGEARSELLTLEVTDPPAGADRDVFLEATVDVADPWVQAQAIVTLRGWFGVPVVEYDLGLPAVDDVAVVPLDEGRIERRRRDGRDYRVLERRYAVFPQASGPVVLEPALVALVSGETGRPRGLLSPTRRLTRRAPPLTLDVRSRPPGGASWWLPARSVTLAADGPGGARPRVGEPLTRTVTLRADAVRAEQLPALADAEVPGASVHAEAPATANAVTGAGLSAERRVVQAIIPQRPGPLTLPGMEVSWFDTGAGVARVATLAPVTLDVAPSARAAPAAPGAGSGAAAAGVDAGGPPPASSEDGLGADPGNGPGRAAAGTPDGVASGGGWRLLAFVAAVGWLLTALALVATWRRGRGDAGRQVGTSGGATADGARRARRVRREALVADVRDASRGDSPPALARAVTALAAARWPAAPALGPAAVADRLDDAEIRHALVALDARLYGPGRASRAADADEGAREGAVEGPAGTLPPEFADRLDAALGAVRGHAGRGASVDAEDPPALPPL